MLEDVSNNSEDNSSERSMDRNRADSNHHVIMANSTEDIMGAPRDKYKFVHLGFMVLGLTALLPWCFFTTATDYWMYKFRNTTIDHTNHTNDPSTNGDQNSKTPLQVFFESYLAIASNFAILISMILNTLYGQKFSQKIRLYVSLSIMLIIFAITTTFVPINTDEMQNAFFAITIMLVVFISFSSAVFQAAVFGTASSFPSSCMHSMVNGQAIAGILAVFVQVLTMLKDPGPKVSGLWYFMASTVFLAFAIAYYRMMDNDYTRFYLGGDNQDESLAITNSQLITSRSDLKEVLRDCWQYAGSSLVTFWATLSVFPGVCVLVSPQYPNSDWLTGRFFVPIVTFLMYNLGDFAGRVCATNVQFPSRNKNVLLIVAAARSILPLLILFCNVSPRHYTAVWFSNDLIYPMLITLVGLTNGYLFSSAMVMASKNCQRHQSELTGFIMATAMGFGLTLGSLTSTVLLRII